MGNIDIALGKRLRLKRQSIGISQADLGEKIGVTFQQVQKYEAGKNRISAGLLWRLSEIFRIEVSYFYDGLENNSASKVSKEEELDKEALSFLRTYRRINPNIRLHLLSLMETIAQNKMMINET